MPAEVASAFVSIIPSMRGFQRRLEQEAVPASEKAGKEAGQKFESGFSKIGGALAGIGVVGFFKDAIAGASDLNESATKIAAIFEDADGAVQKFANGGAAALGQSKQSVLDAAATFGTFGKAAGLSGDDLAGFSTGFVTLATDLASFNNTSPEQAVEAIGSALRGETEPLRAFGVLLDDASLRNEALRLGLIKTTKDALTPQQKVLASQALIYKQTQDAQGDFARTSGGLANQQRILKATFTDTQAEIGAKLLPIFVKVTSYINTTFLPAAIEMGKFLDKNRWIIEAVVVAAGIYVTALGVMRVATLAQAAAAFYTTATTYGLSYALKAGGAAAKAYTAIQWLMNAALTANPIGIVIVAIAALAAGLIYAYKHSETFRKIVDGAFHAVADAVSFMWEKVVKPVFKMWLTVWFTVIESVLTGAAKITKAFGFDGLSDKLEGALGEVKGFRDGVNRTLDGIKDEDVVVTARARLVQSFARHDAASAANGRGNDGYGIGDGPGMSVHARGQMGSLKGDMLSFAKKAAEQEFKSGGMGASLGSAPGVARMMAALRQRFPGLQLISGLRPGAITATGNVSYHSKGRAVDVPPSMAVFEWIKRTFGPRIKELIYSPAGGRQVWNGREHMYTGITRANHWDHVHFAMANGGVIREPVVGMGLNSGKSYAFGERGSETVVPGVHGLSRSGGGISDEQLDRLAYMIRSRPVALMVDGQQMAGVYEQNLRSELAVAGL